MSRKINRIGVFRTDLLRFSGFQVFLNGRAVLLLGFEQSEKEEITIEVTILATENGKKSKVVPAPPKFSSNWQGQKKPAGSAKKKSEKENPYPPALTSQCGMTRISFHMWPRPIGKKKFTQKIDQQVQISKRAQFSITFRQEIHNTKNHIPKKKPIINIAR